MFYHTNAMTATNKPTKRNCLLAARSALDGAESALGYNTAWRWVTLAETWCEKAGVAISGICGGGYYPEVEKAKDQVDQALRDLQQEGTD